MNNPAAVSSGSLILKGHEFVQISYHMPASCDSCNKPLWAPFRPPLAVECKRCRAKFHKEHVTSASGNLSDGIPPCKLSHDPTISKEMLLMATTAEEQQMWVTRLMKKVKQSGYKASHMNAADNGGSGGSMRSNEPMRSASQRSTGGPPSLTTSSSGPKSATLPSQVEKLK